MGFVYNLHTIDEFDILSIIYPILLIIQLNRINIYKLIQNTSNQQFL